MFSRFVLALAMLAQEPQCLRREAEPNSHWVYATQAGTIPYEPATVCGTTFPGDEDWWSIALDYHTTGLIEGGARVVLQSKVKPSLLQLRLYEKAIGGGFEMVGSWYTTNGYLDTGQLGLTYHKKSGLNKLYACVTSGLGSADYYLSYW
jgi:hypothetical protein